MTINYTTLLGLAKPVTGTETGTWGDVVNNEITTLLEDSVANAASVSVTSGNVTLSTTNGASNQARMSTLIVTGTPGTTRNVIAPSQAKIYQVINQSDSSVVIKGSATTGVTIPAGATATVAWNGSDFIEINSTSSGRIFKGNVQVTGNLQVDGNSTLGDAVGDTVTVNGTTTFVNAAPTITPGTANQVQFLNGSKVLSGSSSLTWDGTTFTAGNVSTGGSLTLSGGTANQVQFLNGSKVVSGSSSLTWDGTTFTAGNITTGGSLTLSGGTANGITYLNGSKVATSGSALTFDGTNFATTGTASATKIIPTGGTSTGNGMYLPASNTLAWSNNGSETMRLNSSGYLGLGTASPGCILDVISPNNSSLDPTIRAYSKDLAANTSISYDGIQCNNYLYISTTSASSPIIFRTNSTERARIDSSGNLMVGTNSTNGYWTGGGSIIKNNVNSANEKMFEVVGYDTAVPGFAVFYGQNAAAPNTANSTVKVGLMTVTSRSINAAGTINASGADYAEYMQKNGDFSITKGDVCGIDVNGLLTNKYDEAVSFVVKSTNPSYVGNDSWGNEETLGAAPRLEDRKLPIYDGDKNLIEAGESDEEYQIKIDAYNKEQQAYKAKFEKARQEVDRIAFCGQVPVNVKNAVVGGYVLPSNENNKIKAVCVEKPSFEQYTQSVGKVIRKIDDSTAVIIVKVS